MVGVWTGVYLGLVHTTPGTFGNVRAFFAVRPKVHCNLSNKRRRTSCVKVVL